MDYCSRGHEYNQENTKFNVSKKGKIKRSCRECIRENQSRLECIHGHLYEEVGFRYRVDGSRDCLRCRKEHERKYRLADPEKFKNLSKSYYARHRQKDPNRFYRKGKNNNLKREFGMTLDDYEEMVCMQNNKCAICFKESSKCLFVDHDHNSGRVRGLLCSHCNTGLGMFRDNIIFLENAIDFLKRNGVMHAD